MPGDFVHVELKTNFSGTKEQLMQHLRERVERAAIHLVNETKVTLSGPRSGRVYRVPGTGFLKDAIITNRRGYRQRVKKIVGARYYRASAPGEAPAVRLGDLRRTITYKLEVNGLEVTAKVGSPMEYAPRLEKGSDGGKIAKRPFLRRTYEEQKSELERLMGGPVE